MMAGRSIEPLLPQWDALSANLPFNRRVRILPLLRFLSARDIDPTRVSLADLESYREAITVDRLRKDPEKSWDSLVWSWNACQREFESWPPIKIEREIRREIYILPWAAFPPSLKDDVDRFLVRLSGADLSEDGPSRPARPATLKTWEYQLRSLRQRWPIAVVSQRSFARSRTCCRSRTIRKFFDSCSIATKEKAPHRSGRWQAS